MQPSLFPPTEPDKLRMLLSSSGVMKEFEVIAAAKQRGFKGQGSLEEVYEEAITFLMEVINEEED